MQGTLSRAFTLIQGEGKYVSVYWGFVHGDSNDESTG